MLRKDHKTPKKKVNMAHSKEQNKSPEADPKGTQVLELTKTLK